jgi:hypothetical protein
MTTARARFINPSTGTLVLDSEGVNYGYIGRPTLQAAGSLSSSGFAPYRYRIVMPDAVNPPIVVVKPASGVAVLLGQSYLVSGTTWEITAYSVSLSSLDAGNRNTVVVAPDLYVWGPMTNSGHGAVFRLFAAAGVVTFDSAFKPLWLKGSVAFPARSGTNPLDAAYLGDSQALPGGISVPGVISVTRGLATSIWLDTGDDTDFWGYGWSLSGSNLLRRRFWLGSSTYSHPYDPADCSLDYQLGAATALLIDLNGY